jgi:HK97 family phage major capsid protein
LLNPSASKVTVTGFRYGSKGCIVSNELVGDSLYDLNGFLQNIFAKRIGKITNTEFTNSGSGGPTEIIPAANEPPRLTSAMGTVATMFSETCSADEAQRLTAEFIEHSVE